MARVSLADSLGNERWAIVQRSACKESVRNCLVEDVTIGDLNLIAQALGVTIQELVEIVLSDLLEYEPD
jgi:hypothetical protein